MTAEKSQHGRPEIAVLRKACSQGRPWAGTQELGSQDVPDQQLADNGGSWYLDR